MVGPDSHLLQRAEEIRTDYLEGLEKYRNHLKDIAANVGWKFFYFSTETNAEVILKLILNGLKISKHLAR